MPNFVDITNRVDKKSQKKYSLTVAYIGKKSLYAFKNRVDDIVSFFGSISNIEIMYVDTSKTDITDVGDILDKARIIIPDEDITISEAVSTAISLASSQLVLVMTVNYRPSLLNTKSIRDIFSAEPTLLCITPTVIYQAKRITETVKIGISGNKLDWVVLDNAKNPASLTPNNFLGIYNRNLFTSIGGYLKELPTNLSLIEFGIRVWSGGCIIISTKDFLIDKIADFDVPTSVLEKDEKSPSFKHFLSKRPFISILEDILSIPILLITLRFKDISKNIRELVVYLKNKDKISIFTPDVEKIASIISYYEER
ncbi:MAG: hypothetical protein RMJ37_05780 [Spirochaetia bacterium]|nr:hypothetical protein [Spirochaetota bacterium]MDW8112825.1 hypothetical protein [Spirochaetia bacterium]